MNAIDSYFVQNVINHGNSIISMILIVTLVCCGALLILTVLYIPYFIYVESILKKMIDFVYLTD